MPRRPARPSTATEWVALLADAKRQGKLEAELRRLSFIPLMVVDEGGYIPLTPRPRRANPQVASFQPAPLAYF